MDATNASLKMANVKNKLSLHYLYLKPITFSQMSPSVEKLINRTSFKNITIESNSKKNTTVSKVINFNICLINDRLFFIFELLKANFTVNNRAYSHMDLLTFRCKNF